MGRPEKFSSDHILDAAGRLLEVDGPTSLSVARVARELGAPSGSVYHRFASRDVLVASMWLRSVERFHEALADHIAAADADELVLETAVGVVKWATSNPFDARLLLLHRSSDLVAGDWPETLVERNNAQRRRVSGLLELLTATAGATSREHRQRVAFAAIDVPYAAVRGPLGRGEDIPKATEALVADAVTGIMNGLRREQDLPR